MIIFDKTNFRTIEDFDDHITNITSIVLLRFDINPQGSRDYYKIIEIKNSLIYFYLDNNELFKSIDCKNLETKLYSNGITKEKEQEYNNTVIKILEENKFDSIIIETIKILLNNEINETEKRTTMVNFFTQIKKETETVINNKLTD